MAYQFIRFDLAANIATISLNRPDVLNSFNMLMAKELQNALKRCEETDVRAVVLTAEGRAFCAGQDLDEVAPAEKPWPDIRDIVRESYNQTIKAIRNLEKPIICAVNGVAAGAGANIVLACDFVIASERASFLQAFCHIGLIPDSGGTYFLPRLVGLPRATAMMMLGEKIKAAEAYDMGMIYKVSSEETFRTDVNDLAVRLSKMATRGLGLTKHAINQAMNNTLEQQLDLEEELQGAAGSTDDYREGVRAFLAKRKPVFHGK
ncbi:MAG: enoyl-CoA hydratase-related protein [Calditrichia bacterium]